MSIFSAIAERLGVGHAREEGASLAEQELHLAAAALLIHAAMVDGTLMPSERNRVEHLLKTRFDLDDDALSRLMREGEAAEREAVDLYSFTSVLKRELDQEGRQRIVGMLWEIVYADGEVHEFESNLVWRVAELLGVSTRDRVRLRKAVERRM